MNADNFSYLSTNDNRNNVADKGGAVIIYQQTTNKQTANKQTKKQISRPGRCSNYQSSNNKQTKNKQTINQTNQLTGWCSNYLSANNKQTNNKANQMTRAVQSVQVLAEARVAKAETVKIKALIVASLQIHFTKYVSLVLTNIICNLDKGKGGHG